MAKRKSTDKTSKDNTEQQADADHATDQAKAPEPESKDMDVAAEAVEAVEVYAPADGTETDDAASEETKPKDDEAVTDDVVEQPEPNKEADGQTESDQSSPGESPTAESDADTGTTDRPDEHLSDEEAEKLIAEAEHADDHPTEAPYSEASSEPETLPVAPQVIKETTVERKGGFVPMLLGGAAAAILGYGAAAYTSQAVWPFDAATDTEFEDEIRDALTSQDGTLSDLGTRIATLEGAEAPSVDLGPLEAQIASVQDSTSAMSARLDEIVARIDTLERQPLESAVSQDAIDAYERALADLRAEIETQRAEVAQMAQEAVAAEENAEAKAQLAASRAAMAEISTALDTGAAYSGAMTVLASNGVEVPDILAANADSGVPTQAGLVENFPDAARAALAAARTADTEGAEGMSRVTTFFANQLGARSVAPKEGDDADAVLSRAEAAVRSGDLSAALSELSALPEVAGSVLSDWQARAQTRLDAKTAADALVQQLLQE